MLEVFLLEQDVALLDLRWIRESSVDCSRLFVDCFLSKGLMELDRPKATVEAELRALGLKLLIEFPKVGIDWRNLRLCEGDCDLDRDNN